MLPGGTVGKTMSNYYHLKCIECDQISEGFNHGDEMCRLAVQTRTLLKALSEADIVPPTFDSWYVKDRGVDGALISFVWEHVKCTKGFLIVSEYASYPPEHIQ